MARVYTGNDLIISIRNLPMIPNNSAAGSTDADLLRHADEAMIEDLVPLLHQTQEEYLVAREREPLVSGTKRYRLPTRAMWNKLRHIRIVDSTGAVTSSLNIVSRDQEDYTVDGNDCYLEGNWLHLLGDSLTGLLEYTFYFRPGQIQKTDAVAKIIATDGASPTTKFTVSSTVPSTFLPSINYDIHSGESGAEVKAWDIQPVGTPDTDEASFTKTDIDGSTAGRLPVVVGDYICLAEETGVVPLPKEWHPLVARAAALRYVEATEDFDAVKFHAGHLNAARERQIKSAERRGESKPMRIGGKRGPLYAGRSGAF